MKLSDIMTVLSTISSVIFLIFIGIILGTLMGGFVGWVIGTTFPVVIDSLNTVSGLSLTSFEMGAVLGFVSSFVRPNISVK